MFSRKEIRGDLDPETPDRVVNVGLFVNDLEVTSVDVLTKAQSPASFRFPMKDIWLYCGPAERLSVRADGSCLRLPNGRCFYRRRSTGQRSLEELRARLELGEIMDSRGELTQPKYLDMAWQKSATRLYKSLHQAVKAVTGYDIFLVYGSLLGAVREGRPLGHDLDFDAAYMSKFTSRGELIAEAKKVARSLRKRGFSVEAKASCLKVSNPEHTQDIDLYYYSFDESGKLRLVLGQASDIPFTKDQWDGLEEVEFAGSTVFIPRNAEDLVATLYGPEWKIPNPGFHWGTARVSRAGNAMIPKSFRVSNNWDDYWTFAEEGKPSSFAEYVVRLKSGTSQVVDLGCGDGRDLVVFAQAGRTVLGVDRSPAAVKKAKARSWPDGGAEFAECSFETPGALGSVLDGWLEEGSPTLYYARHLFDSLPEVTQVSVLETLGNHLRPGDEVAFEFRTPNGARFTPNEVRNHGRREVDPASIRAWAEDAGLTILVDEESTKWVHEGKRTASLCRFVAGR